MKALSQRRAAQTSNDNRTYSSPSVCSTMDAIAVARARATARKFYNCRRCWQRALALHGCPDCVNLVGRYLTHLFLDDGHSKGRRLNAHAGAPMPGGTNGPAAAMASTLASIRACIWSMSFEQEPAWAANADAASIAKLSGIKRLMGMPCSVIGIRPGACVLWICYGHPHAPSTASIKIQA